MDLSVPSGPEVIVLDQIFFADVFHQSKVPKMKIAGFFKDNLAPTGIVSFKSGETLYRRIDDMVDSTVWTMAEMDFRQQKGAEFYMRNIIDSIKYLASQQVFAEHIV